jgi:hypothetical protein
MSGISIITNFDLQQAVPIDSRLVATNSTARLSTPYPYVGLKVYQTDNQLTYTYIGNNNWIVEERGGIYGGSGSLIGDTFVDFGTTSNTVGSQSYDLVWKTDADILTKSYLYNNFVRHTIEPTLGFRGTEFRQQFKYFNGSSIVDSAFISFNPVRPDTRPGALAFSTGFGASLKESLRISTDGKVGIGTIDPKEYFQIGTPSNSSSLAQPLVIHRGGSSVIGYNWYYNNIGDNTFTQSHGSSKITQTKDEVSIQNRLAGTNDNNFVTTIFTTATQSGRVGIKKNNPSATLDVNGDIRSNSLISGATISSDNRSLARRFDLTGFNNTRIYTFASSGGLDNSLAIAVGGTAVFRSNGNTIGLDKNTLVNGNLDVGYDGADFDLTVYGSGQITNFEQEVQLIPISLLTNDSVYESKNYSDVQSLSSFTYSFSGYRVGALTHLNFVFRTTSSISANTAFRGFLFKFSNSRFLPVSYGFGTGYAFKKGQNSGSEKGFSVPLTSEVFLNDSDDLFSTTSTTIITPASGSDFYLRVRTHNFGTQFGEELKQSGNIFSDTVFKGSIVYKSGTPPTGSGSSTTPTVVPGPSS